MLIKTVPKTCVKNVGLVNVIQTTPKSTSVDSDNTNLVNISIRPTSYSLNQFILILWVSSANIRRQHSRSVGHYKVNNVCLYVLRLKHITFDCDCPAVYISTTDYPCFAVCSVANITVLADESPIEIL
jgi:hypothetical protein